MAKKLHQPINLLAPEGRALLRKMVPLLQKHGIDIDIKGLNELESIKFSHVAQATPDQKALEKSLYSLHLKLIERIKKHFSKQHLMAKIATLSWLSFSRSLKAAEQPSSWTIFGCSFEKNKPTITITEGSNSQLTLNERLYLAFCEKHEKALTAMNFCSYLYETVLNKGNPYGNVNRIKRLLNLDDKKNRDANNLLNFFSESLQKYLSKGQSENIEKVNLAILLTNHYHNLSIYEKNTLLNQIKNINNTFQLDQQLLDDFRSTHLLFRSAEAVLNTNVNHIKNKPSIVEAIDIKLGPNATKIKERKKLYSAIRKTYSKTSFPKTKSTSSTFTLTEEEHFLFEKALDVTLLTPAILLVHLVLQAIERYKSSENDQIVSETTSETRGPTYKKTFRLDKKGKTAITDLVRSIRQSKKTTPRALNNSLAVGIAIRLFSNGKQNNLPYSNPSPTDSGQTNDQPQNNGASKKLRKRSTHPVKDQSDGYSQLASTPTPEEITEPTDLKASTIESNKSHNATTT